MMGHYRYIEGNYTTLETRELEKLEATNAVLLEALEYLVEQYPNNRGMNKATAAINKAKSHADTLEGG